MDNGNNKKYGSLEEIDWFTLYSNLWQKWRLSHVFYVILYTIWTLSSFNCFSVKVLKNVSSKLGIK